MRTYFIIILLFLLPFITYGQKYKSHKSHIRFFSSAPLEDIEAINKESTSIFNSETNQLVFSIPIKGFQFEKSLMQEHFNENYLESSKYPTATFNGKITGFDKDKTSKQNAKAIGTMKIHGVEKKVEIEGEITMNNDGITMKAVFPIQVADYDIEIPKVVFYNIAEVVEVTVDFSYSKM